MTEFPGIEELLTKISPLCFNLYCSEIFINIKVLFLLCSEPKNESTGLKYVSLIDSLSNNYFLLPDVLRKKFF